MADEIIEALEFAIAEKKRRLEYYETQVNILCPDIKKLEATLKGMKIKTPPLSSE